jgi:preprotein translocase subunit SecG
MLHTVLMVVHIFAAMAIIGLVLIQRGKGADAGAGFGAGASGTVFGARGAGTALSRATAILAAVFMATSLSLTYVAAHGRAPAAVTQDSALDRLAAPVQPATATPADAVPGASAPNTSAQSPAVQGAPATGQAAPVQQPAQGSLPASK